MADSNPVATFTYLAAQLDALGLGYLHVYEPVGIAADARIAGILRKTFRGALIVNGGYDRRAGNDIIAAGGADLVAFGAPFLANPDLPQRLRENVALNAPDVATFFAGEEKGYTDYPTRHAARVVAPVAA